MRVCREYGRNEREKRFQKGKTYSGQNNCFEYGMGGEERFWTLPGSSVKYIRKEIQVLNYYEAYLLFFSTLLFTRSPSKAQGKNVLLLLSSASSILNKREETNNWSDIERNTDFLWILKEQITRGREKLRGRAIKDIVSNWER